MSNLVNLTPMDVPATVDPKQFLYAWLGKNKLPNPQYSVRPSGPKQRQRFLCELTIQGFDDYVACGNSTTKKEAQTNAALDFVHYLERQGRLSSHEIPSDFKQMAGAAVNQSVAGNLGLQSPQVPGQAQQIQHQYQQGAFDPQALGQAYQKSGLEGRESGGSFHSHFLSEVSLEKTEDAEALDVNAAIHGNWTMENAKARLNQYFQVNNIRSPEYKYTKIGPDHGRSYIAEMHLYVSQLGRAIAARETGSTKQSASKSCALSIIRQLYHLNVIPAYSGSLKKSETLAPMNVELNEELRQALISVTSTLDENPVEINENTTLPFGLLREKKIDCELHEEQVLSSGVSWCPPTPNWNAWTGANIDEGPLASASMETINQDLLKAHNIRHARADRAWNERQRERSKLPIFEYRPQILSAIHGNRVVLIRGNTGCGKTTQVCQYILDDYMGAGKGSECNVIITQPRRISALSVSERVSQERSEALGTSVGFSVRFESVLPRPYGSILFCTVGVLLRKLESGLRGISHVLVDEIHERDLNTDFLLVVLRDMVHKYSDLRVVLMSATIDTSLFAKYFNDCPVIEVPGRAFPVQEYFLEDCIQMTHFVVPQYYTNNSRRGNNSKGGRDDDMDDDDDTGADLNQMCSDEYSQSTKTTMAMMSERETSFELIETLLHYIDHLGIPGAILIFLPGWSLIFGLMKHLRQNRKFGDTSRYWLLALHSQLPREEQRHVFVHAPHSVTKIIVSTNIAETSVTIDDVVFVIDSCKAKMKLFTAHNNMTNYATIWASKSNLKQRRGRAGRVRPGFAFHLCSRARYAHLDEHMTPEMFRSPLHEIALTIKLLKLGSVGHFLSKALEPPPIDAVIEAEVLLREMKALDSKDALTPMGSILARLPIDPRLGRMLIMATIFGRHVSDALCTIAAMTSVGSDFFLTEAVTKGRLSGHQRRFAGRRCSDHLAALNAFQIWERVRLNERREYELCENNGMNQATLRITWEAKQQLKELLVNSGLPEPVMTEFDFETIHENRLDTCVALLGTGLYPNVCVHSEKRKVLTTESKAALIHKNSVNFGLEANDSFASPLFVFGEKIRTKAINCKHMTMVTPIHILLFASRRIDLVDVTQGLVVVDNWLAFKFRDVQDAARIAALRPKLEQMVVDAAADPEQVGMRESKFWNDYSHLVNTVTALVAMDSILNVNCNRDDYQGPGPAKRVAF